MKRWIFIVFITFTSSLHGRETPLSQHSPFRAPDSKPGDVWEGLVITNWLKSWHADILEKHFAAPLPAPLSFPPTFTCLPDLHSLLWHFCKYLQGEARSHEQASALASIRIAKAPQLVNRDFAWVPPAIFVIFVFVGALMSKALVLWAEHNLVIDAVFDNNPLRFGKGVGGRVWQLTGSEIQHTNSELSSSQGNIGERMQKRCLNLWQRNDFLGPTPSLHQPLFEISVFGKWCKHRIPETTFFNPDSMSYECILPCKEGYLHGDTAQVPQPWL